jgi:hypothetical protein
VVEVEAEVETVLEVGEEGLFGLYRLSTDFREGFSVSALAVASWAKETVVGTEAAVAKTGTVGSEGGGADTDAAIVLVLVATRLGDTSGTEDEAGSIAVTAVVTALSVAGRGVGVGIEWCEQVDGEVGTGMWSGTARFEESDCCSVTGVAVSIQLAEGVSSSVASRTTPPLSVAASSVAVAKAKAAVVSAVATAVTLALALAVAAVAEGTVSEPSVILANNACACKSDSDLLAECIAVDVTVPAMGFGSEKGRVGESMRCL